MNQTLIPLLADGNGWALGRICIVLVPLFVIWAIVDGYRTARLARALEIKAEALMEEEERESFRRWLTTNSRKIIEAEDKSRTFREDQLLELMRRSQGRSGSDDESDLGGNPDQIPVVVDRSAPQSEASKMAVALFSDDSLRETKTVPIEVEPVGDDEEGGVA